MKKHLALTGFMACGKTSIGKQISLKSGNPFIDLDEYIEQQEKKSIHQLFEQGEEYFRTIETYYLKKVLSLHEQHIIALGGGTVCFNNNIEIVLQHTWLFSIIVSADELTERLWHEKDKRPLLKNISTKEELKLFVETKLKERMPFYEKADWIIKL